MIGWSKIYPGEKRIMWLFTTFGFFSIVQRHSSDEYLTVRARDRKDLDRLRKHVPQLSDTITGGGTDYPYRARVAHAELALALANITRGIRYSNFKNEAAKIWDKRTHCLHEIWKVMYGIPARETTQVRTSKSQLSDAEETANAFGGVVIDKQNRVLLREPTNHFDGYVWTFAKGRPDPEETPEQTSLREVREELGIEAKVIQLIPRIFRGGTSKTLFFLMQHVRDVGKPASETAQTCWASYLPNAGVDESEASLLIYQTTNPIGRQRDQTILRTLQELRVKGKIGRSVRSSG
jgi:hypothetical protein